ncbi:mycothiol synthase [Planomonospora venezuelensis]|uniref:Mycothiol acetyltransferase n=1 Tax=Planomonospora venezuelensis TaxID=1999 RepID=A0A841CZN4_PLAVE|nr:mycothiol synthase [Planomonospora venezuelensis]MBB5961405.1 mycothiol synthase [Planomonospora venezuelensis]GIN03151.1 mycothiol acetyltransferase [Planomonospora venezuelensis]
MNVHVERRERLGEQEVAAVLAMVEAATEADGVRPLNEHVMLHLRHGGGEHAEAVLLRAGGELAGYAHVEAADPAGGPSGELVVHPAFRRRGYGSVLLRSVLDGTGGRLRIWAHGGHPGAEALAGSLGLVKVRSLWQMRRPLSAPLPGFTLPEGVRLRAFDPETDREAWVALNARAFAHHPEQGAWTMEDLRRREQEPWFDPAGFFLAVRGERLAGFHWTKVHGAGGGHEPIGEVYVVGVDPAEQGGGLGRSLTLAGLEHLRSRGLAQVMLYVDEDNTAAVRLYERLGFTRWDTDVMFQKL